jgi:23S rRNA pseudouridine1911/1915/1917 synthase
MNEENDLMIISDEEEGLRLDKILASRFSGIKSRTYFEMLFDNERVLLNGNPVKKRISPKAGDEVQVFFILTPEIGLAAENIPLDIIYEDKDIIVVNKPPGLVIHPAVGNWTGTFVNGLMYHCQNLPDNGSLRPGIVHRLDKDTSGVLVAAKSSDAQKRLVEMFSTRKVYKEYIAICNGNPGKQELNSPIGRNPANRKTMAVIPNGRPALSYCETLICDGKISIVKIELATGRTHQIRVHMKHNGTPVLGDATYGNIQANAKYGLKRQMLHAKILRFNHPISGNPMEFEAPLPEDMAELFKKLTSKH